MKTKIKVFICLNDEEVDTLSPEQREILAEKLSETLSAYYTTHNDEFKMLGEKI